MKNSEENGFLSLWRISHLKFQFTGAGANDNFKLGTHKHLPDITEL